MAHDERPKPPRDVILLPLELPTNLTREASVGFRQRKSTEQNGEPRRACSSGRRTYQVGDGSAHGADVARTGLRDELDEPVPLVAVVAAHRRDHLPHPLHRHGSAAEHEIPGVR